MPARMFAFVEGTDFNEPKFFRAVLENGARTLSRLSLSSEARAQLAAFANRRQAYARRAYPRWMRGLR